MTTLTDRCDEAMARAILEPGFRPSGRWVDMTIASHTTKWFDARKAEARAARLALLAELDAAGWQVVPKAATEAMMEAAIARPDAPDPITPLYAPVYDAMLAAAPQPFQEDKP